MLKILTIVSLSIVVFLLLSGSKNYQEVELNFTHNSNELSGSLILPNSIDKPSLVVLFVHGDGALQYDAYGYYRPIWESLAEKGIASFSWNKAGVNTSSGDWQKQSMDDRADEVIQAIEAIKYYKDIKFNDIGLMGFSQAGWVMPLVASKSDYPDFMVIVSGAINWMQQSEYLTKTRLTGEGFSSDQIEAALIGDKHISTLLPSESTFEDYLETYDRSYTPDYKKITSPMTEDRFQFVKLNWQYDARRSLKEIDCPTLAIFGEDDSNIDITNSIETYQENFAKAESATFDIKVYPATQHGMLKSHYFDEINPDLWSVIKLEILGREAFADGYLEFVSNWVAERSKKR